MYEFLRLNVKNFEIQDDLHFVYYLNVSFDFVVIRFRYIEREKKIVMFSLSTELQALASTF